jgi:outer membrane lipoprotein-sorting protein
MRKLLMLSFLAFSVMVGQTALAQNDAKAKAILENVSKKVKAMKSLKANFQIKVAAAKGKTETKKGTLAMKGDKYFVELGGQQIICDNKTVWTFMKAENEVQVNNYNPNEQTISPAKLFTNFYDKEYSYKYVGSRKVNGKDCDIVELTPTGGKAKQFSKIELAVDKSSTLVGGNIWEKNGNKFEYSVSNFTPNAPVTDAMFTFDAKKHPGVEVVDMR